MQKSNFNWTSLEPSRSCIVMIFWSKSTVWTLCLKKILIFGIWEASSSRPSFKRARSMELMHCVRDKMSNEIRWVKGLDGVIQGLSLTCWKRIHLPGRLCHIIGCPTCLAWYESSVLSWEWRSAKTALWPPGRLPVKQLFHAMISQDLWTADVQPPLFQGDEDLWKLYLFIIMQYEQVK